MIARAFGIEEQPDGVLPPRGSWAAGYVSALLSAAYLLGSDRPGSSSSPDRTLSPFSTTSSATWVGPPPVRC